MAITALCLGLMCTVVLLVIVAGCFFAAVRRVATLEHEAKERGRNV